MNGIAVNCPLCGNDARMREPIGDFGEYECPKCGKFELTGSAKASAKTPDVCRKLSGWIRDRNRDGVVPQITSDTLIRMASLPLPSTAERVERLLFEALRDQERLDATINLDEPRFIAATYSWDRAEMLVLFQLLKERGWISKRELGLKNVTVTADGYLAADELSAKRGQSEEVFVAMSFSPEMTSAYERGLQVGIERAGYVPIRVDRTEHVNRIDDEIVARIRRAAFVVADFTDQKSGVYFEAGFALGLNLPVIWSCREDDIDNLHFDIRQYNCYCLERRSRPRQTSSASHRSYCWSRPESSPLVRSADPRCRGDVNMISPTARVDPTAHLHKSVWVGSGAEIGPGANLALGCGGQSGCSRWSGRLDSRWGGAIVGRGGRHRGWSGDVVED